jgi:IS30 family transposase
MDIRSKHLSSEDRGVILAEHNRGSSQRLIGQLLHRPASMIWREVGRKTAAIARVIPPFMGLFETRITRPYGTGSVS